MRALALAVLLAACGPKHTAQPEDDDLSELDHPATPSACSTNTPEHWGEQVELSNGAGASEIERRQNAACDLVMQKLTSCAVADACTQLDAGKLAELDLEHTAPIHLRENLKTCKASPMSSRQVRVYEVCMTEETECGPLAACLENAKAE